MSVIERKLFAVYVEHFTLICERADRGKLMASNNRITAALAELAQFCHHTAFLQTKERIHEAAWDAVHCVPEAVS